MKKTEPVLCEICGKYKGGFRARNAECTVMFEHVCGYCMKQNNLRHCLSKKPANKLRKALVELGQLRD